MKKIYLVLGPDSVVDGYGSMPFAPDSPSVEIDENDPFFASPLEYKFIGGKLTKDSVYEAKRKTEVDGLLAQPTMEQKVSAVSKVSSALIGEGQVNDVVAAQQLNRALQLFANTLPEEVAMEIASIFPVWEDKKRMKPNEYVRHGVNQDGEPQIFRVLQEHISQPDWVPPQAASLFKKVGFTGDGTPVWVQPMGAHDAYEIGDKVSYNGSIYVSSINGNVWAPDVHGWTKQTTTTTTVTPPPTKTTKP